MLTKRQRQILDFVTNFIKDKEYSPSLEEIRRHFRLKSVSTIHEHIESLHSKGYLKKEPNQPRAVDIYETMETIPLLGTIAAGQPILAVEEKEFISVPKTKLSKKGGLFALRVSGKSMVDENINDGDVVIIKSQPTAENGQKVVALVNNSEVTLKKFYKEKNKIKLQPSNPDMKPIYIDPSNLLIQGIVIDIIKKPTKSMSLSKKDAFNTLPKAKRPKGGCELTYQGKTKEKELILNTRPAKLKLIKKYGSDKVNKLILGDNLGILKKFYNNPKIKGKINLIYIDPPFGTGQDFIGYDENKAYSDRVVNTKFLEFLRQRLIFMRELLTENGSFYLHIDQKIGHYVKILTDEVFGEENLRNDITRIKCNPKNFKRKAFGNIKDVIYFYSKSNPNKHDLMYWSDYKTPLAKEEVIKQFPKIDKFGRRYATTPLHAKGETKNGPTGQLWKGLKPPKGRHWRYNPKKLTRLDKQGLIEWSPTGNPRKIIYAHENKGKKIQDIWNFKDPGFERSSYPTEKNEEMLKQIILASSKEGDVILDCFAGSGTTLVAAEKLKRHWIGIDSNKSAVKTAEKKLLRLNRKKDLFSASVSFNIYKTV